MPCLFIDQCVRCRRAPRSHGEKAIKFGFDVAHLLTAVPGKKWWGNKLTMVAMKLLEIAALFEIVRIEQLLDIFRNRREEKAKIKGD